MASEVEQMPQRATRKARGPLIDASSRPPRLPLDPFDCLLLRDLGRQLPGKPKYTTLRDWCERGRMNWNTRRRVRMESIQLPGGEASSLAAYLAFIAKLNEGR